MRNLAFTFWILICFCACKEKYKQSQSVENKVVKNIFQPSKYYSKFKFHNLKEFKIDDSLNKDSVFIQLDSLEWCAILQDTVHTFAYNPFYFYSNFSDSTQITILEYNEDSYSNIIWLLSYDKNGKKIGKFQLAYSGGDGGDSWESYGQFEKRDYLKTALFYSSSEEDMSKVEIDSSMIKYIFLSNSNKVKSDTIFNEHKTLKH